MIDNIVKNVLYKKKDEKQTIGINGFNLGVRLEQTINFNMIAPDNYVEDGANINDHIVNDAITISINGEVADIFIKAEFDDFVLETLREKVQYKVINTVLSKQQQQKIQSVVDKIKSALTTIGKIADTWNRFQNRNAVAQKNRTIQDDFFDMMESIYTNKKLITIEMPFRNYENMLVTSFAVTRDNETQQKLKYSLSAKEVRFAKTIYTQADKYFDKSLGTSSTASKNIKKPTGGAENKTSPKVNNGVVDTKTSSNPSVLRSIFG